MRGDVAYVTSALTGWEGMCQIPQVINDRNTNQRHKRWRQQTISIVYGPSQWETVLQCNVVSHWLGAYRTSDNQDISRDTVSLVYNMQVALYNCH